MKLTAVKTPIVKVGNNLVEIIAQAIPKLQEKTVLAVVSKVFSWSEGRLVAKQGDNPVAQRDYKKQLARQESEWYLPAQVSKFDLTITIKQNTVAVNAGIDESNANNQYLLWPIDPQASLNQLWQDLRAHYGLTELGLIMTDSKTFPLKWGVVGATIVFCGFDSLYSYIGQPDIFGRELQIEKVNVAECLASAAILEMGEGNEQTPLCIISDVKMARFLDRPPSADELVASKIELVNDVYSPFLNAVEWQKGGS